jgi:hypothetical protein
MLGGTGGACAERDAIRAGRPGTHSMGPPPGWGAPGVAFKGPASRARRDSLAAREPAP